LPKKIRFLTEYALHYLKKFYWVIILGSLLGSFIYQKQGGIYQLYLSLQTSRTEIGVEGLYTAQNLPISIANLISYGFTVIAENDRPSLSPIIEDLDLSNDNQTYTFTFKPNLYWHNGKPFSPKDINLNIPDINIDANQPNRLIISLQNTYAPLLSTLSRPIFIEKTLIGLGSYYVTNLIYKDGYINSLTLASNENARQKINYHFYPGTQDLINAFKLGKVDEITVDNLGDKLNGWPNIKITPKIATDKYLAVFINTVKIDNKQLRQAIAYATPKTDNKNNRCLGPISPNSWAYNPQVKEYNTNIDRAKELFASNEIDHLDLAVSDRNLLDVAENIRQKWESAFGIKVNVSVENRQLSLSDYEAMLGYGYIPIDPDQYAFWHSTQTATNITHLNNSRIDKLLEEGRQTQDQLERKTIYQDFQKYLLEESPAVFLEFPTTYTISRLK